MLIYNKLREYADVIDGMSRSIKVVHNNNDIISYNRANFVFEKITNKYCRFCDRCSICWEKEKDSSYKAANILVNKSVENGKVNAQDLPRNFIIRCKNISHLLLDTNASLELEKNNLIWINRINEMKNIMSMQLSEIAKSMEELSKNYDNSIMLQKEKRIRKELKKNGIYVKDIYYYKNRYGIKEMSITLRTVKPEIIKSNIIASIVSEIINDEMEISIESRETVKNSLCEIVLVQKRLYKILTSFKVIKKEGEILCGDNYAIISHNCGQIAMILSDGMGTGIRAFEESKKIIEILENFLQAGFSKEISIKLLKCLMHLNGFENNMYATVDICVIDNYTGECEFIKNGASPSFIKRGCEVEVVGSDSLPVGIIDNSQYDEMYNNQNVYNNDSKCNKKIRLEEGNVIVMITDGLEESMEDYLNSTTVIKDILKKINSNNPKVIADVLTKSCVLDGINVDDISILVGVLWKKD